MGGKNPSVGPGRTKAMGETSQVVHNHHYSGPPSGEMKMHEDSDSDDSDSDSDDDEPKTTKSTA